MSETQVTLATDEKRFLVRVLETTLGETRVEAHHTHFSPEFREELLKEEKLIRGLLEKLRK